MIMPKCPWRLRTCKLHTADCLELNEHGSVVIRADRESQEPSSTDTELAATGHSTKYSQFNIQTATQKQIAALIQER